MLKVGDFVTLKKGLVLGKKYGTVTFGTYHAQYNGLLLRVIKISKVGTAYCSHGGFECECGTIHESMLDVAKFKVGSHVVIWNLRIPTEGYNKEMTRYANNEAVITRVMLRGDGFIYYLDVDNESHYWPEKCLADSLLEDLKPILENEDRLQEQKTLISIGEGVKGSRVLGRLGKTSVRSRPLRNPQRIRGK